MGSDAEWQLTPKPAIQPPLLQEDSQKFDVEFDSRVMLLAHLQYDAQGPHIEAIALGLIIPTLHALKIMSGADSIVRYYL